MPSRAPKSTFQLIIRKYVPMPATSDPRPKTPSAYTRNERVLLTGVPPENRAHLLRLLRSSDRTVRDMALVLVFLDRDAQRRVQ